MSVGYTLPHYARSLGLFIAGTEDGVPLLACDPCETILGRPGFWHGGATSALLEAAALAAAATAPGSAGRQLRTANMTVQFFRGGGLERTFALGRVERAGRRLLNLRVEAWQADRARPVAGATMHVMVVG